MKVRIECVNDGRLYHGLVNGEPFVSYGCRPYQFRWSADAATAQSAIRALNSSAEIELNYGVPE